MTKNKSQSKNWRKVKLEEVVIINPSVKLENNGDYSFIPMEIINGTNKYVEPESEKKFSNGGAKFEEGDILFARITPCLEHGKIAVAKNLKQKKGFGSTEYFIFRGKENFTNTNFIYYFLKTNRIRQTAINSMVGASGRQRAKIEAIKDYEFKLPLIDEQKRIAEILSAFDDKIELNNKINQNLEQTAQTIFKEWLLKNQKSKIKIQKFSEIADIEYGHGPSSSELRKSEYPVYGANGIIGYYNSFNFLNRQIIIGCRGVVGNVTLTLPKCIVTHNSLIVVPKNEKKIFFYYLLKNQNLNAAVGGSAQPQITIKDLAGLDLLIPDEKIINKFEKITEIIEKKRLAIFYENKKLAALRDLLLPKLMRGEIRV